jgi:hypothetical protein
MPDPRAGPVCRSASRIVAQQLNSERITINIRNALALLKLFNDIYCCADKGCRTPLVQLDLSAGFDMIDTNILPQRLEQSFGLTGSTLNWVRSYITGRSRSFVSETAARRQRLTNSESRKVRCSDPSSSRCMSLLLLTSLGVTTSASHSTPMTLSST